ncbi:MAG: hypothetical protein Q9225_007697 [Loekoesia sp. 1 TL-2023]
MSLTFALQSLLARHESYVLEAEGERRKMAASIDRLECDKKELEAANARTIEENRSLLDQLEGLNNTISDSETHILALNKTLQSTRQELDRLNALAARTSHLEAQLSLMETEQTTLHDKLASSEEGQRSAIQRCKDAERTIGALQEQIDRIEAEARDESKRHAEIMSRYERRQVVERQLESAAGRLKGAAAATTLGKCSDSKNNVVSHFVKDLLADNASLQMGIMELRQMLMGSNEEVQNLREQMMLHQEVPSTQHPDSPPVTIEKDLSCRAVPEPDNIPALHVHHHYHEASKVGSPRRQRSTGLRRVRKRRSLVGSGVSTPRSDFEGPSTPRTPSAHGMRSQPPSSAATILSQTTASIPPSSQDPYPHRLSIQSANTRSSFAPSEFSSPYPSVFDTLSESSRPTSPDSVDVFLPPSFPIRTKRNNSASSRSSPSPTSLQTAAPNEALRIQENHFDSYGLAPHVSHTDHSTIFEEPENDTSDSGLITDKIYSPSPGLRRSTSHESILSVAGMPPNKLRHQHSQLFRGSGLNPRTSFALSSPITSTISSKPVISATPITAAPLSSSNPSINNSTGRTVSSLGAMSTLTSSLLNQTNNTTAPNDKSTLGKRVGGWVWGKWGVTPMASTGDLKAKVMEERPTGVNQKGSLRKLRGERMVGTTVEPTVVDEGLLRESLGEG